MNELTDFLVEITENSLNNIEHEEWVVLRSLTGQEIRQLWDIDEAWGELEALKAEVELLLNPERRDHIRSRRDLTDQELELLGRLMLARDVFQATQNAFWSPLKYEFRNYEQLMLDTEKSAVLGRGNNRVAPTSMLEPVLEPMGVVHEEEIRRLASLFGERV